MCSLTTECVLLLQNVFSYYRMCCLTTECVLLLQKETTPGQDGAATTRQLIMILLYDVDKKKAAVDTAIGDYRMCFRTIECVLLIMILLYDLDKKEEKAAADTAIGACS